jgi:hypothetical protein
MTEYQRQTRQPITKTRTNFGGKSKNKDNSKCGYKCKRKDYRKTKKAKQP